MRECNVGVGAEIPPPAVLLERSCFDRFAKKFNRRRKEENDGLFERWQQQDNIRLFAGSASSIITEPDRRCFVPSSLRYLSKEYEEMQAVAEDKGTGSSLSAARSVIQESQEYHHVVERAESIALHERITGEETASTPSEKKEKKQKKVEWEGYACEGPGCGVMLRHKSEWTKYYYKKYCNDCYGANNVVPH